MSTALTLDAIQKLSFVAFCITCILHKAVNVLQCYVVTSKRCDLMWHCLFSHLFNASYEKRSSSLKVMQKAPIGVKSNLSISATICHKVFESCKVRPIGVKFANTAHKYQMLHNATSYQSELYVLLNMICLYREKAQ